MLDRINTWDTQSFFWIYRTQKIPLIKALFYMISRSGDGYLYALIAFLYLLWDFETGKKLFMTGLTAYSIKLFFYKAIKQNVKRPRPYAKVDGVISFITAPDEFSFPSGHTAAGFVFACLLWLFIPTLFPIGLVWASLIGFSRVYLGVHYPLDVLAGMGLGVLSSGIAGLLLF